MSQYERNIDLDHQRILSEVFAWACFSFKCVEKAEYDLNNCVCHTEHNTHRRRRRHHPLHRFYLIERQDLSYNKEKETRKMTMRLIISPSCDLFIE